ncbi:MAG: DNA polymerase I [Oscillospiraceae bacterium]|nr:DNA polymerase I [Oscillospiraceae bacterium]
MLLLAVDGNSILNRAFYGIKVLTTKDGFYTNAVTGFMNTLLREYNEVKPDAAMVAFDLKAPTFRHEKCAFYKANRHGMPEELAMQLPKVKELLKDLGVPIIEIPGFEADDILGSVSKLVSDSSGECVILSGDRDTLQLVSENVTVRLVTTRETTPYTPEKFQETYGFEPVHLIDLKALMGDSSDNIPGVPGIGEKTAMALLAQYPSIEEIYENIDTITATPSVKRKLAEGKESAETSKWLATIVRDAPVPQNLSDYSRKETDLPAAAKLLNQLEMFKMIDKLGLGNIEVKQEAEIVSDDYTEAELTGNEATGKYAWEKSAFILSGGSLVIKHGSDIYVTDDENLILKYFESEGEKITFEAKSAYKYCFERGSELKSLIFSVDLAGYLLNSQSGDYSVENLCASYSVPYSDDEKFGDILSLERLSSVLLGELEKTDMKSLYYEIELPLCEVLASMEVLGVRVDEEGIKEFGDELSGQISELESTIYMLSGHEFNISSPKQLGVVLFEELGLPTGKKNSASKSYSTSADVLERLRNYHPIVNLILEYRTLAKLKSTYVDGLLGVIYPDGRVRSEFKQTETRTGRISSANPNIQNIPVRKEIGRNMRKFFISSDGYTLLDADYSQIELRVLAAMCGDKNMIDTFLSGVDIHTRTASQVFGIPEEMVDGDMRRAAKAVNFGIIYGIGAYSLSQDIGVSVAEAKRYIESYLNNFSEVDRFMNETVEFAKNNGYAVTMFNRRRYIPELRNANKNVQAFGKRAAMNAPIQGTAADIIKIAMVKVYRRLKAENLDARLILQVHDELIVEASEDCAEKAAEILHEEMESAVKLAVPLTADVHMGKSWFETKE